MIKSNSFEYPKNKMDLFSEFHETLYAGYSESFRDAYITKNASFMGILVRYFDNPHKVHKMIKRPKVL
jgi:hypothetical protein